MKYMKYIITTFIISFSVTAHASCQLPGYFVDIEWLEKNLSRPDIRLVYVEDVSVLPEGHIPHSQLLDIATLVVKQGLVEGMRTSVEKLEQIFSRLGIDSNVCVVAYDATFGMNAARFTWTLMSLGHYQNAVFNGGIYAWENSGKELSTEVIKIPKLNFKAHLDPSFERDWSQIKNIVDKKLPSILLDVRSYHEYVGLTRTWESWTSGRGHIPGAVHFNWLEVITDPEDPHLKSSTQLGKELGLLGIKDKKQEVITYCAIGYRAAHTWLVLKDLGFENARIYDGSMMDWGSRKLPVTMNPLRDTKDK